MQLMQLLTSDSQVTDGAGEGKAARLLTGRTVANGSRTLTALTGETDLIVQLPLFG